MKPKLLFLLFTFAFLLNNAIAQNVGIGIDTPQAKLHVNGSFKIQNGVIVNGISADSSFTPGSDSLLPTQKAVRRFVQKANWIETESVKSSLVFKDSSRTNILLPTDVFVQGNYAYVTSYSNQSLNIYDISDPGNIVAKDTSITNLKWPTGIFVQGNYAYVVGEINPRLCVYDISNPTNIVAKGFTALMAPGSSVFVKGNYAYVTSYNLHVMAIYDISNPDNIIAKGSTSTNLNNPWSVYVQGNYAYVASTGNSRLCIFDISDPNTIVAKGFTSTNLLIPYSVKAQGNYAYIASSGNDRLCIYDISNPNSIIPRGFTDTLLDGPRSVYIQDNTAYVVSENNNRLNVFDISDPDHIVAKASSNKNLEYPLAVYAKGQSVYVASYGSTTAGSLNSFFYGKAGVISLNESGEVGLIPPVWEKGNGDDIFRINGNVGIGNMEPVQKLSVSGGIAVDADEINDGSYDNALRFGSNNHHEAIGSKKTPGGNQFGLDFYTGAANRMAITNTGAIGINTTQPINNLDINGNIVIGSTYAGTSFAPTDGLLVQGNVGIGTINPLEKLSVNGNTIVSGNTIVNGNIGIGVALPGQRLSVSGGIAVDRDGTNTGTISNGLRFGGDNEGQGIASKRTTGGNQFGLDFFTNSISRISVTNAGNVGIGNAGTTNKLDISGNTNITGNAFISGNLGVGNTAPGQRISVDGSITVDRSGANTGTIANDLRFGSDASGEGIASKRNAGGNQSGLDFYTNSTNRMSITNSGLVGIGVANPSVPLEVTSVSGIISNYGYLTNTGGTGYYSPVQNVPISIRASGRIISSEFNAVSDQRIKRNIITSSSQSDLATLLKIRVTNYQLKDSIYNGNTPVKGLIAQELEKVMPQAVHTNADYVPDIYCLSTATEYNQKDKTLKVFLCKPHQLKVGDKVKLFAGDGMQEQYVSAIDNKTTFTVNNWEIKQGGMNPISKVFVWGKQVSDFHTVDYNQVFSLGISAIQELAKENEELKIENVEQKRVNQSLQQQIDELKKLVLKEHK